MEAISISVIIPAYNAEKSIERCIRSVLNQDFSEFELIVVDDGSVDSTASIVSHLLREDNRLSLVRQENGGEMAARASGIRKSNGQWLYFLDADDALMPDALSSIYKHIADDIDVIVSEYPIRGKLTRNDYCHKLLSFCSWTIWGKLWRRELFDDYVMTVPRYFKTGGDMLTQMRLLRNINHYVLGVPEHKYIYNDNNPDSVQKSTFKDYEYEKRMILEVGQALHGMDDEIIDTYRHWQLVYLSGMMGLKYTILYEDEWIQKLKNWKEGHRTVRERLCIQAIDKPMIRNIFVIEKYAKRTARTLFNFVKSIINR